MPCALGAGQEHNWSSLTLLRQSELVRRRANRTFVPGKKSPHQLETCRSSSSHPLNSHPLHANSHRVEPPCRGNHGARILAFNLACVGMTAVVGSRIASLHCWPSRDARCNHVVAGQAQATGSSFSRPQKFVSRNHDCWQFHIQDSIRDMSPQR